MRLIEGIDITKSMVNKLNEEEEETKELDTSSLEELKSMMTSKLDNASAMEKEVIEDQLDEIDGYETPQDFLEHLCDLCITGGGVMSMIYYDDTLAFLERHQEEINNLLKDTIEEFGGSLKDIFGDRYDETDPMNLETNNKNLFAWFAYEETARRLAYELNDEGNFGANI